jgi:hypothetical protein
LLPGLLSAVMARGAEAVLRNSLYRPAYELLFAPIAPQQKRATKTIVDVGVVRVGDVLGAAIVQLTLLAAIGAGLTVLLGLTAAFSILAALVAVRLHRGYVHALETSLVSRAAQLDLADLDEAVSRTVMMQTVGTLGLAPSRPEAASPTAQDDQTGKLLHIEPEAPTEPFVPVVDPVIARITELRSRDVDRVRRALAAAPLTTVMVPHVIPASVGRRGDRRNDSSARHIHIGCGSAVGSAAGRG